MARRDGATHVMPCRFTDADMKIIEQVSGSCNVSKAEAVRRMVRTVRLIYSDENLADSIGHLPDLFERKRSEDDGIEVDLGDRPFG